MRSLIVAIAAALALSSTARVATGECVIAQALNGSAQFVSDPVECDVATLPASTFKIPHALIALETGVVTATTRMAWDGTSQPFPVWQRDHTLDSSIKSSVFWVYRRTAGLIGRDRMRDALASFRYAADSFDGKLTSFWVDGDLLVTPREQLAFMRRVARYELPVAREHVDTVMSAMRMPAGRILNAAGSHPFDLTWPAPLVVRAKTGNGGVRGERVSWLIGHVETGAASYVFAARVRSRGSLPTTAGADLARRVLNAHPPASW